ncbi:MAG: helicase, partial [Clostridia bacterium]|nr:helicase [Clostridia bacterium]
MLFDFQADIVRWALRRGRACIFADCGMGKTPMQLEWAHHVPGNILIVAPLAVADQTIREAIKFGGEEIKYSDHGEVSSRITITNYERLDHFNPSNYNGIVLDESSILKSYTGKIRNDIIERFSIIPFRLAATATPAPNDFMELGNHAEFVGAMTRTEMLSMFFIHDGGETQKWRLKGHAENRFWEWVASWAVMIRKPSDLGYDDGKFILPPLNIEQITVKTDEIEEGFLFPIEAQTLQERQAARKATTLDRVSKAADIINKSDEQWLVWCDRNDEADLIRKMIDNCTEVRGSDTPDKKKQSAQDFASKKIKVLASKPSMFGYGLNFQNCHNVAFIGLSDSYEQYYQAVRRCWRFGQNNEVNVKIITSELEGAIVKNIERKESDAMEMAEKMVLNMKEINTENIKGMKRTSDDYQTGMESGNNWKLYLGDTVDMHRKLEDNIADYMIFSPPFSSLYTYSASNRDMGNCKGTTEFYEHYKFLVKEQYRTLKPGRLLSFHCMNLPTSKTHDGYIGIKDFRGDLIRIYEEAGFIYHSEVVIWKDPVIAMQRTKALGLLHKQIVKDSAMSRQGIPDYLVTMRKPGINENPITGEFDHYVGEDEENVKGGRFSIDVWQRYASPVWFDIRPGYTLQKQSAKDEKDERHICPLQLDVIHRALQLWSLEGDLVISPFAGIGSEGYEALKMGRKFIGAELKISYWTQAVKNLREIENSVDQPDLFTSIEES